MRKFSKNRLSASRRSTNRRNFLRMERLEARLALATAPVAVNDFYTSLIDQPLDISTPGILANDTADAGASLAAAVFSGPANGTLELSDDGSFHYVPSAGFEGLDSFLYVASDGASDSLLAAVTIRVGDAGDAPVAADDSYSMDEDGLLGVALSDGVLANDAAAEGQTLAASLVSGPAHGALTLGEDGSLNYVPAANFHGADSFVYTATDDAGQTSTATATITVNPVNDKPAAANDNFAIGEDGTLTIDAASGLLANDSDIDGDALTPTITSQPLHGTLTLAADGSFSYTPAANYNGLDGFSYLLSDGTTTSDVASATISIGASNDLPVGVNDEYTTAEDTPLEIVAPGVLANDTDVDSDALSSILVIPPLHGTVTLGADGGLVYTPDANFTGVDGFSYLANDGSGDSEATAVTIHVTPAADAPVGTADAYSTEEDTPLVVAAAAGVLANDSDADGDSVTAALVSGPAHGALTLNADGGFEYTPNANFHGSDAFVYQSSDGTLASAPMTVAITVCPVNDAPTAAGEAYELDQDTTLTVAAAAGVLVNDGDLDGDALTAAIVNGPAHGALTLNADGSFSYTPEANYHGEDSFTYAAGDGSATAEATVALTVRQVIHAPLPATDNYSTGEDVPLIVGTDMGVLANDVNLDTGALTAEVVTGPAHGSLTLNVDGSFTFTPEANWHGSDSFTYKAINNGLETISSANIVVEPLNDAPVAVNDEFTISSGAPAPGSVQANDSDIDTTSLTTSLVAGPAHGSLSLNNDGTFTYTPAEGFAGDDTFRYQLNDGMANSNVATVTLHVAAGPDEAPLPELENQRPIAVNDTFFVESGQILDALPISGVLFNDTDPEGSPLTAGLFSGPLHGSLTLAADGSFSYTPTSGYEGMDAFLYRVTDGELWSAFAAVTIHVTPAQVPDEAPLPELAPEPAPTPEPCQIVCDDAPEEVPEATPDDEGSCFEDAVDALFSRGRWYA